MTSFLQLNCGGAWHSKVGEVVEFCEDEKIDVIVVSETWLCAEACERLHDQCVSHVKVPGWSWVGRAREGGQGGGVGFLVRDGVSFCPRPDLSCVGAEVTWIEIFLTSGSILVSSAYVPPNDLLALRRFTASVRQISTRHSRFMLCGDFNSHSFAFGSMTETEMGVCLRELQTDLGLTFQNQLGQATRFGYAEQADSVLDLTFTSKIASDCFSHWERVDEQVCSTDHAPIHFSISSSPLPACIEGLSRTVWNFSKCDWSVYRQRVSAELRVWMEARKARGPDVLLSNDDFEEIWREWMLLVLRVAGDVIGSRNVRRGGKRGVVWWTKELTRLKKVKRRLERRWRRSKTAFDRSSFRAALNEFQCAKNKAQLDFWKQFCSSLETCSESVRWKRLKTMRPSNPKSLLPLIDLDGDCILDEEDKVNALNSFFSGVAKTFDSSRFDEEHFWEVLGDLEAGADKFLPTTATGSHENRSVSVDEVQKCVQSLKPAKACGPDGIPGELLRHGGSGLSESLSWLFNLSWDRGYLPLDWRTAHITPVPKESHARKLDRFRPISLLCVASKVMEMVVKERLDRMSEAGNWFSRFQGSYRKGRSSTDQLVYMSQRIHDEFERGRVGVVAFIDVAKAYDCLWREGLLHSLLGRGVEGKMLLWVRAFLSDRRACVTTPSARSSYLFHETGIPQGSVLSPFFFNVFMADLFDLLAGVLAELPWLTAEMSVFADDITIMAFSDDPEAAAHEVNVLLRLLDLFGQKRRVFFSADKMCYTVFSRRKSLDPRALSLFMDDVQLKYKSNPRHLGVWWDPELTFSHHVKIIAGRGWGRLNSVRRLCGRMWGVSMKMMRSLYVMMIRPVLEFACCVWDCAPRSVKAHLDKVQRASLLAMTGALRTTSERALQAYCFLPSLQDRRDLIQLQYAQRVVRLDDVHPLHSLVTSRDHLSPRTHAPSNSFHSRTRALSRALFRGHFQILGEHKFAEPLPTFFSLSYPPFSNAAQSECKSDQVVRVFTDGSARPNPGPCGCGVLIQTGSQEWNVSRYVGIGSNLMAELAALQLALEELLSANVSGCVIVYSDCQVAIHLVTGVLKPSGLCRLVYRVRCLFSALSEHATVSLQWIRGHSGIHGNEVADKLAKAAIASTPHPLSCPLPGQPLLPLSVAKSMCSKAIRNRWQERWLRLSNMRESHCHTFSQIRLEIGPFAVAFLGRRKAQVTLARLRLGHLELAESLSRFDRSVSPFCQCAVVESVSHFLLHCPLHAHARARMYDAVLDAADSPSLPSNSHDLLSLLLGTLPGRFSRASSLSIVNAVFAFVLSASRVL